MNSDPAKSKVHVDLILLSNAKDEIFTSTLHYGGLLGSSVY